MIKVPDGLWQKYDEWMKKNNVPTKEQATFCKWLRYYLDFCHKYKHK